MLLSAHVDDVEDYSHKLSSISFRLQFLLVVGFLHHNDSFSFAK